MYGKKKHVMAHKLQGGSRLWELIENSLVCHGWSKSRKFIL